MAITARHLDTATVLNAAGDNDATTASIDPQSQRLILAAVNLRRVDSEDPTSPTMTGNGLTWVKVQDVLFDNSGTSRSRLTLFRALGGSPTTGVATIAYVPTTNGTGTRFSWSIIEFAGTQDATNGDNALIQSVVAEGDGDGNLAATLSAFANSNNATYAALSTSGGQQGTWTGGSGFTLHGADFGTVPAGLASEYKTSADTSVDATWGGGLSDTAWAVIAAEISQLVVPVPLAFGSAVLVDA